VYDSGLISFGDYAGVDYITSSPSYSSNTSFTLQLGSKGVHSSGADRSYSTRGVAAFRVVIIGGPRDKLFRYVQGGSL
jgi:hypothetical protein